MTQQLINVGTTADDHTGDPARVAFQKVNDNFAENYASIATAVANDATHASQIASLGLASAISYNNATSGLTASQLQAVIDEILSKRIRPNILLSERFGLVGDNSTVNDSFIDDWINEQLNLIAAGKRVQMVLGPGVYRFTNPKTIDGRTDILFDNAILRYTGSTYTAPALTWGNAGATLANVTGGIARDVYIDTAVAHNYYNRNFIGFRALNKSYALMRWTASGFTTNFQLAADYFSSYNLIQIGSSAATQTHVEFCSLTTGTPFVSENKLDAGNIQATSGFNNVGSCYHFVCTTEYDTGYHGNSGNTWYKPVHQMNALPGTWSGGASLVQHRRYHTALTGAEWLCKTSGTSGSTEPSIIPSVAAGTRVDLTAITTFAGNANITVSSTAGISAGWHMRGTNPLSNFPFDTYVVTVTDGTHLLMSNPAASDSSIYRAHFIAPTVDNGATLIYVGPYRRPVIWHRDSGASNAVLDSRRESSVGEALIASGPYMWPQQLGASNSTSLAATVTLEGVSVTDVKDCRYPTWTAGAAYLTGEMVRVAAVGSCFLECIVAGNAHASVEPTMVNKPGTTTVDNGVTWIERAMTDTTTRGDIGNYSGALLAVGAEIRHTQSVPVSNAETLTNMHRRAIGSANGWIVQGFNKASGNTLSSSWSGATDFLLSREGLLIGSGTVIGVLVRTDKQKYFRLSKLLGTYKSQRIELLPFDKAFVKMDMRNSQSDYNPRIQCGNMTIGGGLALSDPNDNNLAPVNVLVGSDVPYVFVGLFRGSTGTPVACTMNGLQITALPFNCVELDAFRADVFTLHGMSTGPRASLGTPTNGFFMSAGEFIKNASATDGAAVDGWNVKTAGIIATDWATSTVYLKGQLVAGTGGDANRVYAANGSFTSGTAPTGTALNQVDGTATAIVSGDVATWDYMGVKGVLTPTEDTTALYSAGNAGAAPVPNCQNGLRQQWTQSANMTPAAPTNPPSIGSELTLLFTSNGIWTTTWAAPYRDGPAWIASANGQKATAKFAYDGTGWQFVGGSTAFA